MQQQIFTIRNHKVMLVYQLTEHGVLMLASVLNSERAVQVSIALVDLFVKLRDHFNDPLLGRVHRLEQESGRLNIARRLGPR